LDKIRYIHQMRFIYVWQRNKQHSPVKGRCNFCCICITSFTNLLLWNEVLFLLGKHFLRLYKPQLFWPLIQNRLSKKISVDSFTSPLLRHGTRKPNWVDTAFFCCPKNSMFQKPQGERDDGSIRILSLFLGFRQLTSQPI